MLKRDNLHKIAVRVNLGTGLLIKIGEKSFVLTAKHCLSKNNKNKIKSENGKTTYEVGEVYLDNTKDMALMEVDLESNLLVKGTTDISICNKTTAYGFPNSVALNIGLAFNGEVKSIHKGLLIEMNNDFVGSNIDDKLAIENIRGWSGSGIFKVTDDGELFLIGISTELTDRDNSHKLMKCIYIEEILEFIASCELGSFEVVEKLESNDDKKEQGEGDIVTINSNIIGIGIVTGGSVNQTTNSITHNYNNTKGTIISGNNARVTIDEQEENLEQKLKKKLYKFLGMKF